MSRLPPRPKIEFRSDGTPVAAAHDDVYFSAHDGLAESRSVFLNGCGLPEAWKGRDSFCVAELGFGTGLNFLALWDLWSKSRPKPGSRLDFVSFEGFPMARVDARRALSRWPELEPLSDRLIERWPPRFRGVFTVEWPEDGVRLTLYQGDISAELPRTVFIADAWFLDGFSPAKNVDMWSDRVLAEIGNRSRIGTRAGTFTVAGQVRRGLSAAGFSVEKAPGFGRKRERLEAVHGKARHASPDLFGLRSPQRRHKRIAIIGAGVAGACLAHRARNAGLEPVIFDQRSGPAQAASGNALALVHPRLDASDTAAARIHLQAGFAAKQLYARFPEAVTETRVLQLPANEKEAERQRKLLEDPPIDGLERADGGISLPVGMIVRPRALIESLLEACETHYGAPAEVSDLRVNGESFDAVVFANAMAAFQLGLPLEPKRGQVESFAHPVGPKALTRSNYLIADGENVVFGATFLSGDAEETHEAEQVENLKRLGDIDPETAGVARSSALISRAGVRATSPDRLPLAGARPDLERAREVLSPLSRGGTVSADLPLMDGQFVLTGLGSRGFTLAPLMADLVVSQLLGRVGPVSCPEAEALSPARFLIRDIRRGRS